MSIHPSIHPFTDLWILTKVTILLLLKCILFPLYSCQCLAGSTLYRTLSISFNYSCSGLTTRRKLLLPFHPADILSSSFTHSLYHGLPHTLIHTHTHSGWLYVQQGWNHTCGLLPHLPGQLCSLLKAAGHTMIRLLFSVSCSLLFSVFISLHL